MSRATIDRNSDRTGPDACVCVCVCVDIVHMPTECVSYVYGVVLVSRIDQKYRSLLQKRLTKETIFCKRDV